MTLQKKREIHVGLNAAPNFFSVDVGKRWQRHIHSLTASLPALPAQVSTPGVKSPGVFLEQR